MKPTQSELHVGKNSTGKGTDPISLESSPAQKENTQRVEYNDNGNEVESNQNINNNGATSKKSEDDGSQERADTKSLAGQVPEIKNEKKEGPPIIHVGDPTWMYMTFQYRFNYAKAENIFKLTGKKEGPEAHKDDFFHYLLDDTGTSISEVPTTPDTLMALIPLVKQSDANSLLQFQFYTECFTLGTETDLFAKNGAVFLRNDAKTQGCRIKLKSFFKQVDDKVGSNLIDTYFNERSRSGKRKRQSLPSAADRVVKDKKPRSHCNRWAEDLTGGPMMSTIARNALRDKTYVQESLWYQCGRGTAVPATRGGNKNLKADEANAFTKVYSSLFEAEKAYKSAVGANPGVQQAATIVVATEQRRARKIADKDITVLSVGTTVRYARRGLLLDEEEMVEGRIFDFSRDRIHVLGPGTCKANIRLDGKTKVHMEDGDEVRKSAFVLCRRDGNQNCEGKCSKMLWHGQ